MARIGEGRGVVGVPAGTPPVSLGRPLHAERLVGAFPVELPAPPIEAPLLGPRGGRGGPRRLRLQGPVHPFVRPVLLGVARSRTSTRIPSWSHQALSCERPQTPRDPKGEPLSTRRTSGRPKRRNMPRNTGRTRSPRGPATIRHVRTYRQHTSLIVSGSQRCPSRVRNHPLKSAAQTAFGWVAAVQVRRSRSLTGRRPRVFRVSPARWSRLPIVLTAGTGVIPYVVTRISRSFFGPQVRRRWRSRSTRASTAGAPASDWPAAAG